MELLLVVGVLIAFTGLAVRFGHDSRYDGEPGLFNPRLCCFEPVTFSLKGRSPKEMAFEST